MENIRACYECKTINECHDGLACIRCGECLSPETHCHDKNNKCMPFIEDCMEHYEKCADNCHEECSCQNP